MNNIKKFINYSTDEAEKAIKLYRRLFDQNDFSRCDQFMKSYLAFSEHAAKLTLLLNDESKQPQPPISQTPMLGELPPVGNSNIEENLQAVEGATPVVGQNEQTVKGCRTCKNIANDGKEPCISCGDDYENYSPAS